MGRKLPLVNDHNPKQTFEGGWRFIGAVSSF